MHLSVLQDRLQGQVVSVQNDLLKQFPWRGEHFINIHFFSTGSADPLLVSAPLFRLLLVQI
jgi:hypothetical protein